ncbi:MAG: rhomboid family intramembrane serine protease [Phycisphaerales bacterium]
MGIHDRDYFREAPQRRGVPLANHWSVTTWIIVLCVAVFAVDGFLPLRAEPVRSQLLPGVSAAELSRIRTSEYKFDPPSNIPARQGLIFPIGVQLGTRPVAEVECRIESPLQILGYFSTAKVLSMQDPVLGWSGLQVWRFITFQFLHHDLNHLIFNMLTLFFFGGMVEQYLGRKRFLAFYLLCGCAGGLMYLLLNGLAVAGQAVFGPKFHVPGLLFNDPTTMLIGASAGVFGVIMAAAFLAPNAVVYLFFIVPMRLRTLAYGLLAFALLTVYFGWSNAGGEAAHIGGALAGFYLIRNPAHLHGFFDFLGQFDPTSRVARARAAARRGAADTMEIDRILAKIRAQGLQSLTDAEKRTLREASRR